MRKKFLNCFEGHLERIQNEFVDEKMKIEAKVEFQIQRKNYLEKKNEEKMEKEQISKYLQRFDHSTRFMKQKLKEEEDNSIGKQSH
jgi:hypothetical protein